MMGVEEDKKVKRGYNLLVTGGSPPQLAGSLRINHSKIILYKATETIERLLRKNKIPFLEYEKVEIKNPRAKNLNVNLPEKLTLIYQPS